MKMHVHVYYACVCTCIYLYTHFTVKIKSSVLFIERQYLEMYSELQGMGELDRKSNEMETKTSALSSICAPSHGLTR